MVTISHVVECQAEMSERERWQAIEKSRLILNSMEIKYLDYVMQDCEGDLHLLYRQTLNENNAVTKQLWEEGNERETPPKGSWSRVADQYLLEIHPKMPTWSLFQPHEILRY